MSKFLGVIGIAYLLIQPAVTLVLLKLRTGSVSVYAFTVSYMVLKETYGPLKRLHEDLFPHDPENYERSYVAAVTVPWINLRCISYAPDTIWGEVAPSGSWVREREN